MRDGKGRTQTKAILFLLQVITVLTLRPSSGEFIGETHESTTMHGFLTSLVVFIFVTVLIVGVTYLRSRIWLLSTTNEALISTCLFCCCPPVLLFTPWLALTTAAVVMVHYVGSELYPRIPENSRIFTPANIIALIFAVVVSFGVNQQMMQLCDIAPDESWWDVHTAFPMISDTEWPFLDATLDRMGIDVEEIQAIRG